MMIATHERSTPAATVPLGPSRRHRDSGTPALRELANAHTTVRWLLGRLALMCQQKDLSAQARRVVARRLCSELIAQMQAEEELLFPRLRDVIADSRMLDTAEVEHECLRQLIERLLGMEPDDPLFEARVAVIGEFFEVQLQRELSEIFPLLRRLRVDGGALGAQISERRDALLAEMVDGHSVHFENEDADPVGAPAR
jgi:hypothetical protein